MSSVVQFAMISNVGDHRGALYRVAQEFIKPLGAVGDVHFGEVLPGAIRGNHAHRGNSELLLVSWNDRCEIAWDGGEGTPPTIRNLEGHGTAALLIPPLCAHALSNTGGKPMDFISIPSAPYDITDVIRRQLL